MLLALPHLSIETTTLGTGGLVHHSTSLEHPSNVHLAHPASREVEIQHRWQRRQRLLALLSHLACDRQRVRRLVHRDGDAIGISQLSQVVLEVGQELRGGNGQDHILQFQASLIGCSLRDALRGGLSARCPHWLPLALPPRTRS